MSAICTRLVDVVNKAEPTEEDILKSRLVVRGPTCSMATPATLSLSSILSACRDTDLWTGDISAAFLQGGSFGRTLALSMPRGGINSR